MVGFVVGLINIIWSQVLLGSYCRLVFIFISVIVLFIFTKKRLIVFIIRVIIYLYHKNKFNRLYLPRHIYIVISTYAAKYLTSLHTKFIYTVKSSLIPISTTSPHSPNYMYPLFLTTPI